MRTVEVLGADLQFAYGSPTVSRGGSPEAPLYRSDHGERGIDSGCQEDDQSTLDPKHARPFISPCPDSQLVSISYPLWTICGTEGVWPEGEDTYTASEWSLG